MGKPVFEDIFKASGRRNRKSYLLYCLAWAAILVVVALIGAGIIGASSNGRGDPSAISILVFGVLAVVIVLMAASSWMVGAQRCRDFGWTGWAILLTAIPYLGLIFALALWFIPGNQGDNRYGADPLS